MTAAENMAAVLAALNASLGGAGKAYDLDKVPTTLPTNFVQVTISRRFGSEPRTAGRYSAQGWRVTTQWVAQASIANARNLEARCHAALEGVSLTVGDRRTTSLQLEPGDPIARDDGYWVGMAAWTYVL